MRWLDERSAITHSTDVATAATGLPSDGQYQEIPTLVYAVVRNTDIPLPMCVISSK